MMLSENLSLPLSQRTVLVTTDVVRAVLGVDAETVTAKVDKGELQWVFDVSVSGGTRPVREFRFWARELMSPEGCPFTPEQAVQLILGTRPRWRGVEIQQLLLTSRPSVMRWHRSGDLPGEVSGNNFWVTRQRLERFLTSRLCGHATG
jgi:hypothetical protein